MTDQAITIVITALAVLLPVAGAIIAPLIKLTKTIQRLDDTLENLSGKEETNGKRIDDLEDKAAKFDKKLDVDKKRLDNLSERMHKIDGEVGFIDKSKS